MAAGNGHGGAELQARRVPGVEGRAGKFPGPSLIPALNAIQREHGWLPREELVRLSQEVRRPLYEIEGLMSFYPHYRTDPPRKVQLAMCHDLSCWLHDSDERIAELRSRYGDDLEVELVEVSCLGRCDIAPAVAVDERPAAVAETEGLVDAARSGEPPPAEAKKGSDERRPNDPYAPGEERYRLVRRMLAGELDAEEIVSAVSDSGLRGMGGAGLPDRAASGSSSPARRPSPSMSICNADESEPGTFKDRADPGRAAPPRARGDAARHARDRRRGGHRLHPPRVRPRGGGRSARRSTAREAEGLARTSSAAVAASTSRSSSPRAATSSARRRRCSSALEGHRGEPRNKPPFPGTHGL